MHLINAFDVLHLYPAASNKRPVDGVNDIYSFVSQGCRYGHGGSEPVDQPSAEDLAKTQHADLLPRLRGYQQRAVAWMLKREQRSESAMQSECELICTPCICTCCCCGTAVCCERSYGNAQEVCREGSLLL